MQKYTVSSGHTFLNTGITVIRFTLGIRVSATAYLALVTLLLVYIFIHNMVQFGNKFPQNIFICWLEHFGICTKRAKFA